MQRLITKPLWEQLAQLQFFSGSARFSKETVSQEKNLPTPIYIQSPIAWLINKIDFRMLKAAWDSEFDENEFKRGAKQASIRFFFPPLKAFMPEPDFTLGRIGHP